MFKRSLLVPVLIPLLAAGCDSPAGSDGNAPTVAIRFGASSGARASISPALARAASPGSAGELTVQGSNGTLRISDVRFIVSEFKLKRDEQACRAAGTDSAGCKNFKAAPSFVQLPLGSGTVDVATGDVPPGTYRELEFEVEDVEVDEDDDSDKGKSESIQKLFAAIRGVFADWPAKASMVVVGTFTPAGRTEAVPFRTYFDAEIEVEMDLVPALTLSGTGSSRTITVDVKPALWFRRADGRVWDLSASDYARTRRLVEFEVELENGFQARADD